MGHFWRAPKTYELEGFFHQFKSALDMLVKIAGYVFDRNPTIPKTYGDAGRAVVSYLRKRVEHFRRSGRDVPFLKEE
jgi:hypothetical protein